MFRLCSSARLLRKLCESSRSHGRREVEGVLPPRWLSGATSAGRDTSLLRPLPGLQLPPCLPDQLDRHPTSPPISPRSPTASASPPRTSRGLRCLWLPARFTHLLEKLEFKDTCRSCRMSSPPVSGTFRSTRLTLHRTYTREQMVYSYDTLKAYLPQAVEVLLDCVRNPLFLQDEVERQLALAQEVQGLHKNFDKFLQEALNPVGYTGALANPLVAPEEALGRINDNIIQ